MSKNVNSSAFRKFDVDQFNDEFKDDENQAEVQSAGTRFVRRVQRPVAMADRVAR